MISNSSLGKITTDAVQLAYGLQTSLVDVHRVVMIAVIDILLFTGEVILSPFLSTV